MNDHPAAVLNPLAGTVVGVATMIYQNALSVLGAVLAAAAASAASALVSALVRAVQERSRQRAARRIRELEDKLNVAQTDAAHARAELERERVRRADG